MKKAVWLTLVAVLACAVGCSPWQDKDESNHINTNSQIAVTEDESGKLSTDCMESEEEEESPSDNVEMSDDDSSREFTQSHGSIEEETESSYYEEPSDTDAGHETTDGVASTEETTEASREPEKCVHSFGNWENVKQATCQKMGEKVRTCSQCGERQEETLPKVEHIIATRSAQAATCTTTGLTEGTYCSVCNQEIEKQMTVEMLPHEYVDDKCKYCGTHAASEGLEFTKTDTGYAVSGWGTCGNDRVIVIPSVYNGLPVTEIASGAFYASGVGCVNREFILPDSIQTVQYHAFDDGVFFKIYAGKNVVFKENSVCAGGGCEIIYSSIHGVPSNAIVKSENAPYVVHNGTESRCQTTEDGFVFLKSDSVLYLCAYTGTSSELVFPSDVNGERYIISKSCFSGSKNIIKVKFGDGVIGIGESAFAGSSLEEVDLSGSITEIPGSCFFNCQNIENVVIPDNITAIGGQAFQYCGLKTVIIGKNVVTIGQFAFENDSDSNILYFNAKQCEYVGGYAFHGMKKVVIGASVQTIAKDFMRSNRDLTSVKFEEGSSCKSIGVEAFCKTSITEITLPKSITHIYYNAFAYCAVLEKINLHCERIESGASAFEECGGEGTGIEVTVSAEVTVLPDNFMVGSNVKTLVFELNSSCEKIGKGLSSGKISNLVLPASVKNFNPSSFDLKTLTIDPESEYYKIQDFCLISLKDATLVAAFDKNFIIPEEVTTIAKGAFMGSGATHVYVPDTVLIMEEGSLSCATLESLSLPFIGKDRDTPTMLLRLFEQDNCHGWIQIDTNPGSSNNERFYVPPNFSKLTVRDTAITNGLFGLHMLKEISIASSVATINQTAFAPCTGLTHIYYGGTQEQWDMLRESGWLAYVSMNVNLTLNAKIDG